MKQSLLPSWENMWSFLEGVILNRSKRIREKDALFRVMSSLWISSSKTFGRRENR